MPVVQGVGGTIPSDDLEGGNKYHSNSQKKQPTSLLQAVRNDIPQARNKSKNVQKNLQLVRGGKETTFLN